MPKIDRVAFSLLLNLDDINWWQLERELLLAMISSGVDSRLKSGLILPPLPATPQKITMSPYVVTDGRKLTRTTTGYLPLHEERLIQKLLKEVRIVAPANSYPDERAVRRSECVTISETSPSLRESLIKICLDRGVLIAALTWSEDCVVAGDLLWNGLILRNIICDGTVITDYEDFPDHLNEIDGQIDWTPDRSPEPPASAFFFWDGVGPSVERKYRKLNLPADLKPLPMRPAPPTPLQRALKAAGKRPVLRISGHDRPEIAASFDLPYIHLQFPDLLAAVSKVRKYCLNRDHVEGKWVGFILHGYGHRPTDATVLASYLVGAMLGKFLASDVVATSNGELQFSAGIAVPSFSRHRALLNTAWIAEPGKGFRLTTAYPENTLVTYADAPLQIGAGLDIVSAWDIILEQANLSVADWTSDGVWARPRLYVPRSGTTGELTRQLVKRGAGQGTYSRAALGGRSLLAPLGPAMSWSQAAFVTASVQTQLGMRGVLSMPEIWVD